MKRLPFAVTKEITRVCLVKIIPRESHELFNGVYQLTHSNQCLAGFSLYFNFSSSGTGSRRCLAKDAAIVSV